MHYASDGGTEQTDITSFPFGQFPSLGSGFNLVAPEWYGTENATAYPDSSMGWLADNRVLKP
ncbi:hypothetical protein [Xenorhabdus siamensis]|uniref:hypothetical protein n=1 Tax=Xenorhabdus siamensis TaxID=3136254 RepID=UPI0030F4323B